MDTNESKDDGFCPECGRELIRITKGDYYCPYCGCPKAAPLNEGNKVIKTLNAKKERDK